MGVCRRGSLVWLQAVGKGVEVLQQQAHHQHVLLRRREGLLGRGAVSGWARATAPTAALQETSIRPGRTSHAAGVELTAAQSTEACGLVPALGRLVKHSAKSASHPTLAISGHAPSDNCSLCWASGPCLLLSQTVNTGWATSPPRLWIQGCLAAS